jgi:hypothetical protein
MTRVDRDSTSIAVDAGADGRRRTSLGREIERLFAEYAASLRRILGPRDAVADESTHDRRATGHSAGLSTEARTTTRSGRRPMKTNG